MNTSSSRWHCAALAAVCLLCALALSPLLRAPMLYDDNGVIAKDPFVAAVCGGGHGPAGLFRDLWYQSRPVRLLSHRVDALAFGKSMVGPHAENIALHILSGLLFLSVLGAVGAGRGVRTAALAIFLVHPVCVESVGILSHRKELLSALWMMAALRASLSSRGVWRAWAFPCLFLSVFSKETAAAVFPALWVLAVWERNRTGGGASGWNGAVWRRAAVWAGVSAGLAALAWFQIRHGMDILHAAPSLDADRAGHFGGGAPWGMCCSAAIRAFPRYLGSFLTPWGHTIDPVFPLTEKAWSPWTMAGAAVAAAYVAAGVLLWRRRSGAFVPVAWMAAALAPYLFPPLLRSGGTAVFCDRYAYVAAMGFAWLLAWGIRASGRWGGRGWRRPALAVAVVLVFAGVTWSDARAYQSSQSFWRRACRWNPGSAQASHNLAHALWREARDPEGARAEYERMRGLAPGFAYGMCGYADFLASSKDFEGALAVLEEGLANRPDNRSLLRKRAGILLSAGRHGESLAAFRAAEKAGVDSPGFQYSYAEACKRNLLWPEAWSRYRKAALGDPAWRRAFARHRHLVSNPNPLPPGARGIVVIGDSVPHGTDAPGEDGVEHPLSERLSRRLGGEKAFDASVPGSCASSLEAEWRTLRTCLPFRPRWCLVWTGHNDAFFGRSAEDILRDISGSVFRAREAGMWPLVVGPIPVADTPERKRTAQEKTLAELDRKLGWFCKSANVDYVSARKGFAGAAPSGGWLAPGSGNHLSEAGLERMAELCAGVIQHAEAWEARGPKWNVEGLDGGGKGWEIH